MAKFASYSEPGPSFIISNDDLNKWINLSVKREIMRSRNLRGIKNQYFLRNEQFHDYPSMMLSSKPSYNINQRKREASRKKIKCVCDWPLHTIKSQNIRKSNEHKFGNRYKCSLRIAELAIPSKRHCIDTWRNKSYILPDHMVYRLRQYVMDQRPVVKLSEAICCFQMKKHRLKKKCTNNIPRVDVTKFQKPLRYMDVNSLCILLACRIIVELSNVMNLPLSDRAEKICRVVSQDVAKITKITKRGIKNGKSNKYESIHNETCNKITVWLNDILEDAFYKLLEDDLKDLEDEAGPVLDCLDDIIDNVLNIYVPESVPDEVDNYNSMTNAKYINYEINNIINNFITKSDSNNSITDVGILSIDEHIQNEINNECNDKIKDSQHEVDSDQITKINSILKLNEHFHNEIYNLINNIFEDSQHKMDNEQDVPDTISDGENLQNDSNEIVVEDATNQDSEQSLDNVQNDNQDYLMQGVNSDHDILQSTNFIQVPTVDAHDQSINVIFSNIDIANLKNNLISHTNEEQFQDQQNKDPEHIKRNIYFAEPNASLLSASDEPWPSDFSPDVLRPSTSVTKAIESLGNLFESDEKHVNPLQTDEDKSYSENSEHDNKIQSDTEELPQNNHEWLKTNLVNLNTSKNSAEIGNRLSSQNGLNPAPDKLSPPVVVIEKIIKTNELNQTKYKDVENSDIPDIKPREQYAPSTHILKNEEVGRMSHSLNITEFQHPKILDHDKIKLASYEPSLEILENNINSSPSTEKQNQQPRISQGLYETGNKSKSKEIIQDSKVQMEYAPSWVIRRNGHGEPSETSTPGITFTSKHKEVGCTCSTIQILPQCVLERWCKDLHNNFKTLDIWKLWLLNTCKETEKLLRKKNARFYNEKNWQNLITLRNNLNKDVILWRDVNQHAHEKFCPFRKYYGYSKILYRKHFPRCICKSIYARSFKAKLGH